MKTLNELKQEITKDIDDQINILSTKNQNKGSNVLDKLKKIRELLNENSNETSLDYIAYYNRINKHIESISFIKPYHTDTWAIFEKHLAAVKELINQKKQSEELEKIKIEENETAQLQQELDVAAEESLSAMNTLEKMGTASERTLPRTSVAIGADPLTREDSTIEGALTFEQSTRAARLSFERDSAVENRKKVCAALNRYVEELENWTRWMPTLFRRYSIKVYKADHLKELVKQIENKVDIDYKIFVNEAKNDHILIRGYFRHRTLNLFENILQDHIDNYTNTPYQPEQNRQLKI